MKIKKINTSETITITKTNYSNNHKNGGKLLGKTLKPLHAIYFDGKRECIVWKDVNSNQRFMVDCIDGKIAIKNMEFVAVVVWRGFNNDEKPSYTTINWTQKTQVICEDYIVNK